VKVFKYDICANSKCSFVYRCKYANAEKCAKCGSKGRRSLYYLPITAWLQSLCNTTTTWNAMQWAKHMKDMRESGLVMDGAMPDVWFSPLWELFRNDLQMAESGPASIALAFNTDGVCPFKVTIETALSRATRAACDDASDVRASPPSARPLHLPAPPAAAQVLQLLAVRSTSTELQRMASQLLDGYSPLHDHPRAE
jgi:hypothetical protein